MEFDEETETLELTLVPMTTAGLRGLGFGFSVVCTGCGFLSGILMGVRSTVGL